METSPASAPQPDSASASPQPTQTPDPASAPPNAVPPGQHEHGTTPDAKQWLLIICIFLLTCIVGFYLWRQADTPSAGSPDATSQDTTVRPSEMPELKTEVVTKGYAHIWEIAFLPAGDMLFNERSGQIHHVVNGVPKQLARVADVYAQGEGGLMGMAVDPDFTDNRYLYTCYNTMSDIRVVRWTLRADMGGLDAKTPIVTGIPANPSGRHSGCRIAFGPDGFLWIGTGDTAQNLTPQSPQDPKSLAGKILRVTQEGKPAPSNVGGVFDPRIYSYGHRNTQGLAFFGTPRGNVVGVSAEHGSSIDDELNTLSPGNFGWAPPDGTYDESVPMTDTKRFPDAVGPLWSSGDPTQAPAGVAIIEGERWKAWDGAVAMAMLKAQHLKLLVLSDDMDVAGERRHFEREFGRLRAVTMGPDGSLYVGTSNGEDDAVIRVTPQ